MTKTFSIRNAETGREMYCLEAKDEDDARQEFMEGIVVVVEIGDAEQPSAEDRLLDVFRRWLPLRDASRRQPNSPDVTAAFIAVAREARPLRDLVGAHEYGRIFARAKRKYRASLN